MKNLHSIFKIFVGLLIVGSSNLIAQEVRGLQLTVIPDKQIYVVGENVGFIIHVENTGTYPVTVFFPSSCWFDYWIDYNYQYLYNSICLTVCDEFDLLPGQSFQRSFTHSNSQYPLITGPHIISGILNGSPYAYGEAYITVAEPSIQIINLMAGWNLISPSVIPFATSPATVFSSSNMTCTLEMVTGFQNQQGEFYDPEGPPYLNTLTCIVAGEGYWVKVVSSGTLTINGSTFPNDFSIDLLAGWNLIAFWPQTTTTPALAFATLINAGILEMVTGYEQGGKFFDPNGPPYLNTLTEIKNGFGYWVKVSEDYAGFSF